jgi:hypothetical protein
MVLCWTDLSMACLRLWGGCSLSWSCPNFTDTAALPQLSRPSCLVFLSCSCNPVLSFLSCLYRLDCLLWLSWQVSSLSCPALAFLSQLFFPHCTVCICCHVLIVLSYQFCPTCSVLGVLPWKYYSEYPVLVILG